MASATITEAAASVEPATRNVITLRDVDWETYCELRDEESGNHVRMTYLDGTSTLMSPGFVHEGDAEALGLLLVGVTSGLGLEIQGVEDHDAPSG